MNPRFYSTRLSGYTAITMSAAEVAGYPMANLLDYNPTVEWHHSATGVNSYVQINFGQLVSIDYMLIDRHNMDIVSYKLDGSADGSYGSPFAIVAATTAPDDWTIIESFTPQSVWTVRLTFPNGAGIAPSIGNLFFGKLFEFQFPFDEGASENDGQFETSSAVALSGVMRTSQPVYAGRRVWEYTWKNSIDNSEAADIKFFIGYVRGKLTPFYLHYHQDFKPVLVYAELDNAPVPRGQVYNMNSTSRIRLVEWLASDDLSRYDQYAGQTLVGSLPLVGE